MKTKIITPQGTFTVSANYTGSKPAEWGNGQENWNHHLVTVSHNGKRLSFDFWASIANPEIRNESEIKDAFDCFLSDAISGLSSFEDFCSEFGYDVDSRRAERIHKACQRSAKKLQRIFSGDVYDLANAIRE